MERGRSSDGANLKSCLQHPRITSPTARPSILFAVAWIPTAVSLAASVVWLPFSRLSVSGLQSSALIVPVLVSGWLSAQWLTSRLRNDSSPIAAEMRSIATRCAAGFHALTLLAVLAISSMLFSHLAVAAKLPLHDAAFAAFDRAIGFDWIALLRFLNDRPLAAKVVSGLYWSSAPQLLAVLVFLALVNRAERLAETIALLSVSTIIVCLIALAFPAAGAVPTYNPPPDIRTSFSVLSGLWHYDEFIQLRTLEAPMLDFHHPSGVIQFPSLHVVMAILTAFALRGARVLFWPIAAANAVVILGTLPEGGHHLADGLAGAAITISVIAIFRSTGLLILTTPVSARRSVISAASS